MPVAGERRVHVDGVRHHGGAEHRGGEQDGVGAVEARDQPGQHAAGVGRGDEQTGEEPDRDDGEQPDDHVLEPPLPVPVLGSQQEQGHDADDQPAERQRDAEQQLQGDGTADHLGDVGGCRDHLGLHPERQPRGATHALTEHARQRVAGDQPQLGGLVLDQDGHRVRRDEHPEQQVAVPRAGGEVRGDVARVDVGDGRDERGAEQERGTTRARGGGLDGVVRRTARHRPPPKVRSSELMLADVRNTSALASRNHDAGGSLRNEPGRARSARKGLATTGNRRMVDAHDDVVDP